MVAQDLPLESTGTGENDTRVETWPPRQNVSLGTRLTGHLTVLAINCCVTNIPTGHMLTTHVYLMVSEAGTQGWLS